MWGGHSDVGLKQLSRRQMTRLTSKYREGQHQINFQKQRARVPAPHEPLTGFLPGLGKFVLMQLQVDSTASEYNPFPFEPESLFECMISTQLYSASGTQHALPGHSDRAA